MNFFQSLDALQLAGNWTIAIAKDAGNTLVVSVHYFDNNVGDTAGKKIPPINLCGTATEIDEGFFNAIAQPVQQTAQLFTNMEQYRKQREAAKQASQQQKDNASKNQNQQSTKDKKYADAMKKVDELERQGKHREAYVKVPEVADYPEHEAELRARKTALAKKFSPELFMDTPAAAAPQQASEPVEQELEMDDSYGEEEEERDINEEYDYIND